VCVYPGKFSPEQGKKAQRGSKGIALLFLNFGVRWEYVVNATLRPLYRLE
jgi:hypothetical protein